MEALPVCIKNGYLDFKWFLYHRYWLFRERPLVPLSSIFLIKAHLRTQS